jgi:Domain of unknown function (DUF397)
MQTLSAPWRKSSYSANGGQDCVEAASASGAVLIRDTTDRNGATLSFPAATWRSFANSLR